MVFLVAAKRRWHAKTPGDNWLRKKLRTGSSRIYHERGRQLRRPYLLTFGGLAASRILAWMSIIRSHSSAIDISFMASLSRRTGDSFSSGLGLGRSDMRDNAMRKMEVSKSANNVRPKTN
jgi:hypothetical protein